MTLYDFDESRRIAADATFAATIMAAHTLGRPEDKALIAKHWPQLTRELELRTASLWGVLKHGDEEYGIEPDGDDRP